LFTNCCLQSSLDKLSKIIGEDVRILLKRSLLQIKIDEYNRTDIELYLIKTTIDTLKLIEKNN